MDVRPFTEKFCAEIMSDDLTLFGVGTSRTLRAHWMLLELGLDYETHPIQSRTGETSAMNFDG